MKKIKYYILAIFSVLTLCLVPVGHASALSDLTYTFNSSSNSYIDLCGGADIPSCSGYEYLYITTNYGFNTYTSYASMLVRYNNTNQSTIRVGLNYPSILLDISDFTIVGVNNISNTASLPSDWSVTFTLSENNPAGGITPEGTLNITSNGTYDVTNYASASVNIASDLPPYSQLVVDSFWQYHTAFAGAIVAIIAIFLVYRLIKGRLR